MKRALVIGAGITGVATAIWMQRDGWNVTLIDRIDPGAPGQTSYGNAGILARSSIVPVSVPGLLKKAPGMLMDKDSPLFLRWSYLPKLLPWLIPFLRNGTEERVREIAAALELVAGDSVDQHQALARGTAAERFITPGDYMFIYSGEKARKGDQWGHAIRTAHGFEWSDVSREELRALDPNLSEDVTSGVRYPDHGWITSPGKYVAALASHFRAEGGSFQRGNVLDIEPDGTVLLEGGARLEGEKTVLCAGVWSTALAKKLGHKTAMESERGHHIMLKNPSFKPPVPMMVAAGKFVMTPMEDGLRLAGSVQFGGLDAPPSEAALAMLRRHVKRVYPTLTWEDEETWLGHRPSTVDSLPLIGASPKAPNVLFAFGGQHIGLTIGPRLGRMVADIAGGRTPNRDLTPFKVDRFDP